MRYRNWTRSTRTLALVMVIGGCGQAPQASPEPLAHVQQHLDASPLTVEYYSTSKDLTGEVVVTQDDWINYDWKNGGPPVPGSPTDNFSARWTGTVTPPATGNFTFYLLVYDGGRVWLDGQLVIDDWAWDEGEEASLPIALTGGQSYDLKVEYFEGSGSARAHLSWSGPGTDGKVAIPAEALSAPGGSSSCSTPEPLPAPAVDEIYRNDFEAEDPSCWATRPSGGCNGAKVYQLPNDNSGIVAIASNEHQRSGQKSLRLTFSQEGNEGGGLINPNATHLFHRYYDYYQASDFDFGAGMKIARYSGHAGGSNQYDIILVSRGEPTAAGDYCFTNSMKSMYIQRNPGVTFGNLFPNVSFPRGQWISVETEIKLNTPGLSDGEVRVYVDGQPKIEATGLNSVRDADDTMPINSLLMGGWYSNRANTPGTCWNPSPVSKRYIDDVIVSNRYIGPEPSVTRGASCTEQVVAFVTPLAGTTQVEYGPTSNYGFQTTLDSTQVTNHSQTLSGLLPGKGYHYRVKSTWSNGYAYVSPDYTFVAK